MPIGNLGHNPNVRALIPPAPPLPSQTDGAGGARNQLINSNGPMGSRLLFTPIRNSVADAADSRASDIPGLPTNPLRFATSEVSLHGALEVLHDKGGLDILNSAIGSSLFRVETRDDGSHVAIGQKNGLETTVVLSEQEFSSLQSLDPEGKNKFVFTGGRGGAGHAMVTVASDIAEARQRIIDKLEPKDTKETKEPRDPNSGEGKIIEIHTSTSTSSLRADPKLWLSLGTIAAGLIGMAATGIAQAVALTPEPDDPTTTDPDAAANTAEAATKDQLTKEAFQNPDNQKVNIDENGNAIPSGELKDDVVAQIAEQAKAAGEQARQEAIESNSQAQQKYDEQHAKREQEMSLSSGVGYGISGALILGGGIGAGVTAALHRKNQPAEQTITTRTVVDNQPTNNASAQGNTDTSGPEESPASRRNSNASLVSNWSDTSSTGTVENPYADVGMPRNDSLARISEEPIYDEVAADPNYSVIQHFSGNSPVTGRLVGTPGQGIQSTYALLASSGGLRLGMGGLTGGGESAVSTANAAPTPGPARFV
ncbi:type III secretion system LEE translocated intimin receptor Tir [Escherichia albertii]|uniref:type III secretion system LEE translocated intimin receptor Tir n=1 Tax=Escherichia albertii TaxID=208962 RepID=UPI002240BA04|nr:type III secretion system LEE translocated intimin receptor Tir [Escherichia albertii]QTA13646.1 type III secretion system LEE translocated intimin receptor Tir [Escherichia albertii]